MKSLNIIQRSYRGVRNGTGFLLMAMTVLWTAGAALADSRPKTVAEVALYQGSERERILIEGAKKEGQLTLYDSWTGFKEVDKEFEKKYPFIKISEWRNNSRDVFQRVMQEYKAGRYLVDVIETSDLMSFFTKYFKKPRKAIK